MTLAVSDLARGLARDQMDQTMAGTPQRLLVVGNGMASVRFLEALSRRAASGAFKVTVVGAEDRPAYNRVLLSALLANDVTPSDLELRNAGWYLHNGFELVAGDPVARIDRSSRVAHLSSGRMIDFDHCVFATGSNAFKLPVPGIDLPGVITFRDLADVAVMEKAVADGQRVAVIGGGLLGIEAAYGLAKRGVAVTLVHVLDRLMERQLDAAGAALLARALKHKGVQLALARQTVCVTGERSANGLRFADGTELATDLVVCAVGVRPNAALAKNAGLAVNRGIVVDDLLGGSHPGYYAIGECAEHRGTAYGLVEPCYAQAESLAARLNGESLPFTGMVLSTNLKASGVPVFSAGDFEGGEGCTCSIIEDRRTGLYRKLVFRGTQLVGCVLVGDADDGLWLLDLIRRGADITGMRSSLVHGRDFSETLLADSRHAA